MPTCSPATTMMWIVPVSRKGFESLGIQPIAVSQQHRGRQTGPLGRQIAPQQPPAAAAEILDHPAHAPHRGRRHDADALRVTHPHHRQLPLPAGEFRGVEFSRIAGGRGGENPPEDLQPISGVNSKQISHNEQFGTARSGLPIVPDADRGRANCQPRSSVGLRRSQRIVGRGWNPPRAFDGNRFETDRGRRFVGDTTDFVGAGRNANSNDATRRRRPCATVNAAAAARSHPPRQSNSHAVQPRTNRASHTGIEASSHRSATTPAHAIANTTTNG